MDASVAERLQERPCEPDYAQKLLELYLSGGYAVFALKS